MKESYYNFYINDVEDNICLIYNSLENTLIRDDNGRVQNFIKQYNGNIEFNPEYVTENEFNDLILSGMIVSNKLNEKQTAIDINKKRLDILYKKDKYLSLVITPTLRCNFKCRYCFESTNIRKTEDTISMDVQNEIIDFIVQSITKNNINGLTITWYGGEPLMQSDIIFSMQKKIDKICKRYNIKVYSDIITNGILLSPETSRLLYEHGIKQVQVTIDGPELIHNRRRYYPENPANNYNLILENILKSSENIRFNIRVNIDKTNKDFIFDFIDDLIKRKIWPYKKNVSVYPALIRSIGKTTFDLSKKEFIILQDRVRRYLVDKYNEITHTNNAKLKFFYPVFGGEAGCGYGILKNSWIINYNGDVFRCFEFVGQKEHVVCTVKNLLEDFGHSIVEKNKIDNSTFEQWGCFDCKVFPICGAECPWDLNEERRCTVWKTSLEQRLLNQYKQFLKEPEIFKNVPFNV